MGILVDIPQIPGAVGAIVLLLCRRRNRRRPDKLTFSRFQCRRGPWFRFRVVGTRNVARDGCSGERQPKIACLSALKLVALPWPRRTSARVACRIWSRSSYWWRRRPQLGNEHQALAPRPRRKREEIF